MIVNKKALLKAAPIRDMVDHKVRSEGKTSYGLVEAGYDIRIKQTVIFRPGDHMVYVVDEPVTRVYDCTQFCLASTMEYFEMPNNLTGVVHDKSTWAREGLSVFNTVIEAGWKGHLTLELVYHGNHSLTIPAGSGIAQVLFHSLSEEASYDGKYQNQADEPTKARWDDTDSSN